MGRDGEKGEGGPMCPPPSWRIVNCRSLCAAPINHLVHACLCGRLISPPVHMPRQLLKLPAPVPLHATPCWGSVQGPQSTGPAACSPSQPCRGLWEYSASPDLRDGSQKGLSRWAFQVGFSIGRGCPTSPTLQLCVPVPTVPPSLRCSHPCTVLTSMMFP